MNKPAVSVILPVYNGANYLRFAIESVLNQTLRDFELIVVDDGSTDSTPEIARSYGERLRYFRKDNGGVATAFNQGIKASAGQYISWLSHDDFFEPEKLEKQLSAVRELQAPAVCFTDVFVIDGDGRVIGQHDLPAYQSGEVFRHLVTAGEIGTAAYSLFYDREIIEAVGFYDETRRYTQDADMLLRLVRQFPTVHVPQKLMKVREHGERGLRANSEQLELEAVELYGEWLNKVSLEELFPELKGNSRRFERAKCRHWLAEKLARHPFRPYRTLAGKEYLKAMRESPAILPFMIKRYLERYPQLFSLGLRTEVASKLGLTKEKKGPASS